MTTNLDPNFDQLIIICGIAAVLVIGIILFVIKLPSEEREYNDANTNNKDESNLNE